MNKMESKLEKLQNAITDIDILFKNIKDDKDLMMASSSNTHGRLEEVDSCWEKNLGWTKEELESKSFFCFIHPEDLFKTAQAWVGMLDVPAEGFINRYATKDGKWGRVKMASYNF